ncbi:MAG: hypothetical protein WAM39_22715 [Bryobacteraceae bacterium]
MSETLATPQTPPMLKSLLPLQNPLHRQRPRETSPSTLIAAWLMFLMMGEVLEFARERCAPKVCFNACGRAVTILLL